METFVEKLNSVNLEKELYMAFHQTLTDEEKKAFEKVVDCFCYNYIVSASIKMLYTHDIHDISRINNEIRVTGKLEKSAMKENSTPEGFDNQYRILVDDSNYVYFSIENIIEFGTLGIGSTFSGGQHLVLGLRF